MRRAPTPARPKRWPSRTPIRHFPARIDEFSHAGLTFLVAEGDFGCRNLAGGPVRACTTHGGKTYLFDAPGQRCHTAWHAGERVNEILQGLRPR